MKREYVCILLVIAGLSWSFYCTLDKWADKVNTYTKEVNAELERLNQIQATHAIQLQLLLKDREAVVSYEKETSI